MLRLLLLSLLLAPCLALAQEPESTPSSNASNHVEFHVRYVNGAEVYVDGGRSAGLAEGTKLVLKESPSAKSDDQKEAAIEPGVVARLTVV